MADFDKFHQFTKLQDQPEGGVMVWGIATHEQPDLDGEICDYETAVPVYQAWSNAAKERTTHAGQEESLGNVRLQHGIEIGGKAIKLEFDDEEKAIFLGSVPLNDEILAKLRNGFYTGYSQGGSYAWRKCAECGKNLTLQQANNFCSACKKTVPVLYGLKRLSEVSYVDSPASGVGFEYVKADGSKELVKFRKKGAADMAKDKVKTKRVAGKDCTEHCFAYVGDPEKTSTWKLPIMAPDEDKEWEKRHVRNALARFNQTSGIPDDKKAEVKAKIVAAARAHGIDVDDEGNTKAVREFIAAAQARAGLQKGMYAVSRLAEVLQTLSWLYDDAVIEREIEGDDSEVPDDLKDLLERLVNIFIASASEEAKELAAKKADIAKGGSMTPEEKDAIEKAAKKSLAMHFAKSAVHHEKMAKAHHEAAESHEEMCDAAKAAHKACKADVGAGEPDATVAHGDYYKAAEAHHAEKAAFHTKCAKVHEAHAEHMGKMAESHDKEEAEKTLKAERGAEEAPVRKNDGPDDFMAAAVKKAQSDLLSDPAFMAKVKQAQEEALLSGIVNKTVEAEVEKRRETTIAPPGVSPANASGLRIAPRDDGAFKLASTSSPSSDAGI